MIGFKKKWIAGAVAAVLAVMNTAPALAGKSDGFYCDFEGYTGGGMTVENPDAAAPWAGSCRLNGNVEQLYAKDTEKGTSLWICTDHQDLGDRYLAGTFLDTPSVDSVVMQFDVKPLGLGSKTRFGLTGKKEDGTNVYQSLFYVYPDGRLEIYARGTIATADQSISEQCYTENAAVTLRRGNKLVYAESEAVTIPVGEWSSLAAVYRVGKSGIDYYVNGQLVFSNAIPFDSGNSLKNTGISGLRLQTGKFGEFSELMPEEQDCVGLYVDNLSVYFGDKPEMEEVPEPEPEPEPGEDDREPDESYYYDMDFEEYAGGKIDGLGGRFPDQITAVETEFGNSLWMRSSREKMLAASGSATDNYFRPVLGEGLVEDLVFQADVKPIGGTNYTYISLHNAANQKIGGIRIYNDGRINYYNGTADNAESPVPGPDGGAYVCPEGAWVNVAVVFKVQKQVIDVYIDRQRMVKDSPVYSAAGVKDYRYLNIQQTIYNDTLEGALPYEQQGIYMDNLRIYNSSYLHDDETYYASSFDGMDTGAYVINDLAPDSLQNGNCRIEENTEGDGKILCFQGDTGYIRKTLDISQGGTVTASADIRLQGASAINLFTILNQAGEAFVPVRIQNGQLIVHDGGKDVPVLDMEENRWYSVEASYRLAEGKYTVSVDGVDFPAEGAYVLAPQLAYGIGIENQAGTVWIDRVRFAEQAEIPRLLRVEYFAAGEVQEDQAALPHTVDEIRLYFNTAMREPAIISAASLQSAGGDAVAYTAEYHAGENCLYIWPDCQLEYFTDYILSLADATGKGGEKSAKALTVEFSTNAPFTAFEMALIQNGKEIQAVSQLQAGEPVMVELNIISNQQEGFDFVFCAGVYAQQSMTGLYTQACRYVPGQDNIYSFSMDWNGGEEIDLFVLASNAKPAPLYDAAVIAG